MLIVIGEIEENKHIVEYCDDREEAEEVAEGMSLDSERIQIVTPKTVETWKIEKKTTSFHER